MEENILVICDIDNSIADISFRQKKAGKEPSKKNKKEFTAWLERLQCPEDLIKDPPIHHMKTLLQTIRSCDYPFVDIAYLTSRTENYRNVTSKWIHVNGFPPGPIYMRKIDDWRGSGEYKHDTIKHLVEVYGKAGIAIDDDPDGDTSAMYRKYGFVHLKVLK